MRKFYRKVTFLKKAHFKFKSGFSTVEILIALFIFSLVSSAVILVSFGSQNVLVNLGTYQKLLSEAQIELEKIKVEAFYSFEDVHSDEWSDSGLEKLTDVSLIYDYTKKIKSSVFNPKVNFRSVELFSYVSNWQDALGADTCFRKLNDVEDYSVLEEFDLEVADSATDIDVVRDKAYITIDSSGAPNFLIVDISNLTDLQIISDINFSTDKKLNALHVAGKYAYVATNSTAGQLQIIDVFNSQNPSIIEYRLPDPSSTTTALSIFYKDKTIYLGTKKHESGHEFHIIDVSNPDEPQHVGSWETDSTVNNIRVNDGNAFLALATSTPLMEMLNIENPDRGIDLIKSFTYDGPNNQSGQAISLIDNLLILGRFVFPAGQGNDDLFLFDLSLNDFDLETSVNVPEATSIRDLIIRNNVVVSAVLENDDYSIQFMSLDSGNSLGLIKKVSGLPDKPTAIDCEDNNVFVVTESPAKLIIIGKE